MTETGEPRPYGLFTQIELERAIQEKIPAADYLRRAREICAHLQSNPEGHQSFLLRRGPVKQLCDEMVPIGYLCNYFSAQWPSTEVRLVVGNQPYDAIVSRPDNEKEIPLFIEVTGIDVGSSHGIRRSLAEKNLVPETFNLRERLHELADRLADAIVAKSGKRYPEETLLLIFQKTTKTLPGWMNVMSMIPDLYRKELSCFKRVIVMNESSVELDFRP